MHALDLGKEPRHRPHCATHGRVLSYDRLGGLINRYGRGCLVRGFSVHLDICVHPCRGKVHKCARRRQNPRALSKGMADPVRARMTRSLRWAKETTFTSDDISGDAQVQEQTNHSV